MRRLMARATRGWQSCCNLWPEVLHAAAGTAARVDHRRYKGRQRCYDFGPAVLYAARSAAASGAARQVAGDGCGAERMASEDRAMCGGGLRCGQGGVRSRLEMGADGAGCR
jgi:hypothetical protein